MIDTKTILDVATKAALAGGQILADHAKRGVTMRNKSADGGKTYDLVSDADVESEQMIVKQIRDTFPDHEIIGEEGQSGDAAAEHLWIIDPLDGTNNYAHGVPHYAVSIGYYFRGTPTVGVIYNVPIGIMYTAVLGEGAHVTNAQGITTRVYCGDQTSLGDVLVGCGFYYDRGDVMRRTLHSIEKLFDCDIHGIRRFGTASLDLAMVGTGMFGAFFEYELSPWDFAAGILFVTEAGGIVTTTSGENVPIGKSSLLASAAGIHQQVLNIVSQSQIG